MHPRTPAVRPLATALVVALLAATVLFTAWRAATPPGSARLAPAAFGLPSHPRVHPRVGEQSRDRLTITVTATGFSGAAPGLVVALTPTGYVSSASSDAFIDQESVTAGQRRFTVELKLDADQVAELDPSRTYQILTVRAGHRDLYDMSQTTRTPVHLDFNRLSRPQPSGTPSPSASSTPSGGGSATGSGTGSGAGTSGGPGSGSSRDAGSSGATATSPETPSSASGRSGRSTSRPAARPWSPPDAPPTSHGLSVENAGDGVDVDKPLTASATGFGAHEDRIRVVVYSSPIVLSTSVRADASGRATWTGRLPEDIGLGEHTLTFQGSVQRGVRFTVVGTPDDGECRQGCPSTAPAAVQDAAGSGDDGGPLSPMTWLVIIAMTVLTLGAGGGALVIASRRQRARDEADDRAYDSGRFPVMADLAGVPLERRMPPPGSAQAGRARPPESFAPPAPRTGPPPLPSQRRPPQAQPPQQPVRHRPPQQPTPPYGRQVPHYTRWQPPS